MTFPLTAVIDKVMSKRRYQYWALQTIGWSGYTFFIVLGAWLWEKQDLTHTLYAVFAAVMGLLLSMGMREGFHRVWDKPPVSRGLLTLLIVGIATGLWSLWKFYVYLQIYSDKVIENLLVDYIYWYAYSFYILLSWTGLYYGIRYYQMMQRERENSLRISSMAHQAQLKMLRYQLNPHFLFNTLNAISTLILDGEGNTANRMVTKLSNFLRYSLDNDPMQKVNLAQEVEAMQLYLDIEKVRFEDRLQLEFQLEEDTKDALIPSMLLQPLIENAIKYAVARSESGGTIKLAARVFAEELLLELSDDGPGMELVEGRSPQNNGVGLTNTQERLQELYGSNHSCKFSSMTPNGFKVSIRIPYETAETGQTWKN